MIRWDVSPSYVIAFSTRAGGVSEGPFASLNLGRKTDDTAANVEENRRRLCGTLGADDELLALNHQHHSATVLEARAGERDERGDGLWSDAPGQPVLALTADCLPIAVARTNGAAPAVSVLHAGWRGLLAGIAEAGIAALGPGCAAVVGPGIGPCCYEVGEDVAERFRASFGADVATGGRLDLWTAAERALRRAGAASVERVDLCTACNPELFFSHRRDAGVTGRQGVLAYVA